MRGQLGQLFGAENPSTLRTTKLLRTLRLFKLVRMLRLFKLAHLKDQAAEALQVTRGESLDKRPTPPTTFVWDLVGRPPCTCEFHCEES